MSSIADDMGRLAERIRLPWRYDDNRDEIQARSVSKDGPWNAVAATLTNSLLSITLVVPIRPTHPMASERGLPPGDTLDALCDRARAAVVELLAAMPERKP